MNKIGLLGIIFDRKLIFGMHNKYVTTNVLSALEHVRQQRVLGPLLAIHLFKQYPLLLITSYAKNEVLIVRPLNIFGMTPR